MLMLRAVESVTPKYYHEHYSCCPPPLFIVVVSLVEIAFYLYHAYKQNDFSTTGPAPIHSPLTYDPYRRHEVWRFLSYTFLHQGFLHIFNNLVLQLVIGIPLEMVHGWWRVALVYFLGSTGGTLAASVMDDCYMIVGASGAVFGKGIFDGRECTALQFYRRVHDRHFFDNPLDRIWLKVVVTDHLTD